MFNPYDPSLKLSYEVKERRFLIKDLSTPPDLPKEIIKEKVRRFQVAEMEPESDLEKIYMEIAVQSRLCDYQQYVLRVKKAHESMLKGLTFESKTVTQEALHNSACRALNKAEYEVLKEKIKGSR